MRENMKNMELRQRFGFRNYTRKKFGIVIFLFMMLKTLLQSKLRSNQKQPLLCRKFLYHSLKSETSNPSYLLLSSIHPFSFKKESHFCLICTSLTTIHCSILRYIHLPNSLFPWSLSCWITAPLYSMFYGVGCFIIYTIYRKPSSSSNREEHQLPNSSYLYCNENVLMN